MDKKLDNVSYAFYQSPIGLIKIAATDKYISDVSFHDNTESEIQQPVTMQPLQIICIEQLIQYFNGERRNFDLPLQQKGTEYQQKVWALLTEIPFGKTISYLKLAQQMGDINATRAVANANGQNKMMLLIPCHRVVGSKGELTGYAGKLWRKKWLLEHERKLYHGIQTLF